MEQAASFYLTLPSNSSMEYFPQNTLACYTTKLYHPLVLEKGVWETAVVEVHYTSSFQNISKYTNDIYYRSNDKEKWSITKVLPGHYYHVDDILSQINHKSDKLNLQLKVKATVKRIEVSRVRKDESVEVRLSPEIAKILGFDHLQQENIAFVHHARYPPDLQKSIPSHMYIYSDIVEPQLVGDTVAPLLRIINTNIKEYGSSNVHIFENPHYVPVQRKQFDQIIIDLRDSTGNPLPFQYGSVCVKLHFRTRGTQ